MDTVKQLADAIIWLVPTGVILRVTYCLICAGSNADESSTYIKRARHAIIFGILAICIWQIRTIISGYYK